MTKYPNAEVEPNWLRVGNFLELLQLSDFFFSGGADDRAGKRLP
jgi:hypothetical protein